MPASPTTASSENVAVDVAYRYMNMGYMDCGDYLKNAYGEGYADIDAYLYAHEIRVGLRFTF